MADRENDRLCVVKAKPNVFFGDESRDLETGSQKLSIYLGHLCIEGDRNAFVVAEIRVYEVEQPTWKNQYHTGLWSDLVTTLEWSPRHDDHLYGDSWVDELDHAAAWPKRTS